MYAVDDVDIFTFWNTDQPAITRSSVANVIAMLVPLILAGLAAVSAEAVRVVTSSFHRPIPLTTYLNRSSVTTPLPLPS